jgi:hypothetical protein
MRCVSSAVLQHVQRHLQRHSRALLPASLILSHYGQQLEALLLIRPYLIKTLQVAQRPRPPSYGEVKRREAQVKLSQQQAPNFLIKNQVDCIVQGTRKKGEFRKNYVQAALSVCGSLTANARSDPARLSMSMTLPNGGLDNEDGVLSPSGMRSTKMQKRQPTLLEKQLEAARRDDFEALLQGQNPQGTRSDL